MIISKIQDPSLKKENKNIIRTREKVSNSHSIFILIQIKSLL